MPQNPVSKIMNGLLSPPKRSAEYPRSEVQHGRKRVRGKVQGVKSLSWTSLRIMKESRADPRVSARLVLGENQRTASPLELEDARHGVGKPSVGGVVLRRNQLVLRSRRRRHTATKFNRLVEPEGSTLFEKDIIELSRRPETCPTQPSRRPHAEPGHNCR